MRRASRPEARGRPGHGLVSRNAAAARGGPPGAGGVARPGSAGAPPLRGPAARGGRAPDDHGTPPRPARGGAPRELTGLAAEPGARRLPLLVAAGAAGGLAALAPRLPGPALAPPADGALYARGGAAAGGAAVPTALAGERPAASPSRRAPGAGSRPSGPWARPRASPGRVEDGASRDRGRHDAEGSRGAADAGEGRLGGAAGDRPPRRGRRHEVGRHHAPPDQDGGGEDAREPARLLLCARFDTPCADGSIRD